MLGALTLEMIVVSCASEGVDRADPTQLGDADGGLTNDGARVPVDASEGDAAVDAEACTSQDGGCKDIEWYPSQTGHPLGLGLAGVWGSGPNDVWAVGAAGSALHWDGTSWTSTPIDTTFSLRAVFGTGPKDIWAVATAHLIFHSTGFSNGTAEWSLVTPVTTPQMFVAMGTLDAIWGTSPSDIWVSGKHRMTRPPSTALEAGWRSVVVDGGLSWTPVSYFDNNKINGIWGSGPGDIWMVGAKGSQNLSFSVHTNGVAADGGVPVWTEVDTHTFAILNAVWGSGPGDVWAVGDRGTIRHYFAGAKTWSVVESPTTEDLRGIWGAAPDDIWAVGKNGTFVHYDGSEWRTAAAAFPSGEKLDMYNVWGSGPSDVWAVGDGIVMHYTGPKAGARGGSR